MKKLVCTVLFFISLCNVGLAQNKLVEYSSGFKLYEKAVADMGGHGYDMDLLDHPGNDEYDDLDSSGSYDNNRWALVTSGNDYVYADARLVFNWTTLTSERTNPVIGITGKNGLLMSVHDGPYTSRAQSWGQIYRSFKRETGGNTAYQKATLTISGSVPTSISTLDSYTYSVTCKWGQGYIRCTYDDFLNRWSVTRHTIDDQGATSVDNISYVSGTSISVSEESYANVGPDVSATSSVTVGYTFDSASMIKISNGVTSGVWQENIYANVHPNAVVKAN